MKNYYIYILKLEEKKYYIGYTNNIISMIQYHLDGKNEWTNLYKVNKLKKKKIKIKDKDCVKECNKMTLKLMKKYGWINVRGSIWEKIKIEKPKELDLQILS